MYTHVRTIFVCILCVCVCVCLFLVGYLLRATLNEGPRSRDQGIQAILLVDSFKLVPKAFRQGSKTKSGKLRLNVHGTYFGGKINWFRPENSAKRRAPGLENQESG
jgi:hypothetical protein